MQPKKTRCLIAPAACTRKMLAFDIETTGLDPSSSVVTVVCTEDFHTGERRAYEFGRVRECEPDNEALLKSELVKALDEAESLCAFNGVRFDIPFLHKALELSDDTTTAWLFKTTDILEAARLGIFGPAHTFGLNMLCQHNQIAVKSGSGLQAIKFAQEHKWDELKNYCADDVRILCDLYRRRFLNNPRFHRVIDLSTIAHVNTYQATCKQKKEHALQTEPCAELADLKQRLLFYQEHVFSSAGAEQALALLLSENARQKEEISEVRKKLAVYDEYCVCFGQEVL
jgi:hypothetical protein